MMKKAAAAEPQSPRALATREKNREAVRKCRQRKRERNEELKIRCDELTKENVRLRMHLELGNEEALQEKALKGKRLLGEMEKLLGEIEPGKLSSKERTPAKAALDSVYGQFLERHMELGPDRLSSLSFVAKRLHGLIDPDVLTKAYLFILTLPDSEEGDEWWDEFVRVLELTEEQQRQIKLRRLFGHRLKAELFYVSQRAASMSKSIMGRKNMAMSFVDLMKSYTSPQLAKYVLWVNTDACGNELLDLLWDELIEIVDQTLTREDDLLGEEGVMDIGTVEVQRLLNLVRLENGGLFKTLFENQDIRDSVRLSNRIFTQDVVLIDPSNGGKYTGLDQVIKYIDKMRRAFIPSNNAEHNPPQRMNFEQMCLEFSSGDKAIGKYQIKGMYHGHLAQQSAPPATAGNTGSNPPTPKPVKRPVSVECVVSITFAEDAAKIKELVVSTDMMGLFAGLSTGASTSSAVAAAATHALPNVDDDDNDDRDEEERNRQIVTIQESRTRLLQGVQRLFEEEGDILDLARALLDERCVFVDSNMVGNSRGVDECVAYIKRIRSAFPKFHVVQQDCVQQQIDAKERTKLEWQVEAAYGGKLASQHKPCTLQGLMFLTTDEEARTVTNLSMSWNATSLFRELGVSGGGTSQQQQA
ncbi:hypothetical protein BASA81_008717 [Batrachochytrium salamandrivorans]|nr:hypothetical protein BASA81_008717 [Batrachochytrium salamandrivorans]